MERGAELFTGPFTAPVPQGTGPARPYPAARSVLAVVGLIALHCAVAAVMTWQILAAAYAASDGAVASIDELQRMGPRPYWAFLAAWVPWVLVVLVAPPALAAGAPRAARIVPLVGIVLSIAAPFVLITTFAA